MGRKSSSKEKELFEVSSGKEVVIAWLQDSQSPPHNYLTKEGMAYLNGFLQSQDSMGLIKVEKYDDLLNDYEELLDKYEKLKKEKSSLTYRLYQKLKRLIK